MSVGTITDEVREYLDRVSECLADLVEAERADLLEDLEGHLREVAAEADGGLVERLGPPAAYAEELRTSAGLAPAVEMLPRRMDRITASLSRIGQGLSAASETPAWRWTALLLHDLRPGWWVLRGHLAIVALSFLSQDYYTAGVGGDLMFPSFYGTPVIGLTASLGAIMASVWLGRRGATSRAARHGSLAASIVVLALFVAAPVGSTDPVWTEDYKAQSTTLMHEDGGSIVNVCPYATDGTLLDGVLLFDQNGRAITNTADSGIDGYRAGEVQPTPIAAVPNSYPKPQVVQDPATGGTSTFSCPSLIVPAAPVTPPASDGIRKP